MKKELEAFFNQYSENFEQTETIWVALSGGLDSVVLLDVMDEYLQSSLARFGVKKIIKAIHVNHALSPNADSWQEFCENLCTNRNIEYIAHRVSVDTTKNIEEQARKMRYRVFEKVCQTGDLLLTAHHANDQAETLLFRLFRGSHTQALASIPVKRDCHSFTIFRPLLKITRHEILSYAKQKNLEWIEDESNLNQEYSRNFLRHTIIPQLEMQWPEIVSNLSHMAARFEDYSSLLQSLAEEDYQNCLGTDTFLNSWGRNFCVNRFVSLSKQRQENLIRFCLTECDFSLPSQKSLDYLIESCEHLSEKRFRNNFEIIWKHGSRSVHWRSFGAHLFFDFINDEQAQQDSIQAQSLLHQALSIDARLDYTTPRWRYQTSAAFKNIFQLPSDKTLSLRYRKGGERCRPAGRRHSQSLKKLLQEYRVPTWERAHLPLLYCGEELLAVADLWVCEPYALSPDKLPVSRTAV